MAQCLGALTDLPEDQGLVPSPLLVALNHLQLHLPSRNPTPLSGLCKHFTHVVHMHTFRQTLIHIIFKKKFKEFRFMISSHRSHQLHIYEELGNR